MASRSHGRATLALILVAALWPTSAPAAGIAGAGPCSLVDAIQAANLDQAVGGCPAGSGADTIVLSGGTIGLTAPFVAPETSDTTGLPPITSDITIEGNGVVIERQSFAEFRIFGITPEGSLTLRNVTVQNGQTQIVQPGGGGVKPRSEPIGVETLIQTWGGNIANLGRLTLYRSTVAGGYSNDGGGIYSNGRLDVLESAITGNRILSGAGAGIYSVGTLAITDTVLSGNQATTLERQSEFGGGGAVYSQGEAALLRSTLSDNQAWGDGGGIYSVSGLTLTSSTVSGNSARGDGGGIHSSGALVIRNSTITGNTADVNANGLGDGGGVFVAAGSADVGGTIIAANADTPAGGGPGSRYPDAAVNSRLQLSVVAEFPEPAFEPDEIELCVAGPAYPAPICQLYAGSFGATSTWPNLVPGAYTITAGRLNPGWAAPSLPQVVQVSQPGADVSVTVTLTMPGAGRGAVRGSPSPAETGPIVVTSSGHNLVGSSAGAGGWFVNGVGGDRVGSPSAAVDPGLLALADNGGRTPTHALRASSPALDAGGPTCPALDQRGAARPYGTACDVGAFEQTGLTYVYLGVVQRGR